MVKRRTHDSEDYYEGSPDDPIGLTSAFASVRDPQAVQYDKGDQAIGLTEAFSNVPPESQRAWEGTGKWKDFDWNSGWDEGDRSVDAEAYDDDEPEDETAAIQDEQEDAPAVQAVVADAVSGGAAQAEVSTTTVNPFNEEARSFDVAKDLAHASAASVPSKATIRGKHAAHAPQVSERVQKSHRTRKTLIVVIVLLALALCALGVFVVKTVMEGQEEGAHQAQEQVEAPKGTETETEGDDTVETAVQLADVPDLSTLFGLTTDEVVSQLGRGAIVSSNQAVKDKKSVIKNNVTVALSDEPADSKTGTPNVYLGLDKDGRVIQVGYSASASSLGFGSLSFADAVNSEHVVEATLAKIGVEVAEGSAILPKNSADYSTYADDGTTVVKERCSFEGDTEVAGVPCTWSSVLSYDYTTQVITGNLSDTVRIIYVYVTQK